MFNYFSCKYQMSIAQVHNWEHIAIIVIDLRIIGIVHSACVIEFLNWLCRVYGWGSCRNMFHTITVLPVELSVCFLPHLPQIWHLFKSLLLLNLIDLIFIIFWDNFAVKHLVYHIPGLGCKAGGIMPGGKIRWRLQSNVS